MVGLLIVVVLARLLTPEAFGVVAAAQVVLALAQMVVDFGIGAALVQTRHVTPRLERTALTIMLSFALVMAAVIALTTPLLAELMKAPELNEVLPVMLITFVFASINNPSFSLLTREMRFRLIAGIDLFAMAFIQAVVAISLALMGWSYWSVILAMLASTAAKTVIVHFVKPIWPILRFRWSDVKLLSTFGGGAFLSNFFAQVAQRADYVVVSSTMGLAPLGFYSRAYKLMDLSNSLLGSAFRSILFAGFSRKRRERSGGMPQRDAFLAAHVFAAIVSIPMSATMFVLAPEVVAILLGGQWAPVVPLLQILALGMTFRLGSKVSHAFNLAEGAVYATAVRLLIYAMCVAAGAWAGSFLSLEWVAGFVLGAVAIQFGSLTQLAMRACQVTVREMISALGPFLLAGAVACIVATQVATLCRRAELHTIPTIALTMGAFALPYLFGIWLCRQQHHLTILRTRLSDEFPWLRLRGVHGARTL